MARLPTKKEALSLAFVIVCLLYLGYRVYESRLEAAALDRETSQGAVPTVSIAFAKPVPSQETITLPGNIQAWYQAPIYARVTGYVKMWFTDYGAHVKEGEVLAEINTPALDAEYQQARADLESERAHNALAQISAARWAAMRKNHAVSEQSITVKEKAALAQAAKLRAAEQKVKNIEAFINFKTVLAPYDGVVIARNVNVGDYVNKEGTISSPGSVSNLFTVANVSKLRLFVSVPESFGPFLKPGLTAKVTTPQLPDHEFKAQFLTVAEGFDVSTRTAVTEFTIDNDERLLWPGSYAVVEVTAPVSRNTLTIPTSAMVFQEHGTQVATVSDDNHVHFKSIKVTKIRDKEVEVIQGISESDRIVKHPTADLLEGDPVRIVSPAPGYELSSPSEDESNSNATPSEKQKSRS